MSLFGIGVIRRHLPVLSKILHCRHDLTRMHFDISEIANTQVHNLHLAPERASESSGGANCRCASLAMKVCVEVAC